MRLCDSLRHRFNYVFFCVVQYRTAKTDSETDRRVDERAGGRTNGRSEKWRRDSENKANEGSSVKPCAFAR